MQKIYLKMTLAWVVGITIACIFVISSAHFFGHIHLEHFVTPSLDEEGEVTRMAAIQFAMFALAIMLGVRSGMAIYTGEMNGGVSVEDNLQFFTWVLGILVWGIVGTFVQVFFGHYAPGIISAIACLGWIIAIPFAMARWMGSLVNLIQGGRAWNYLTWNEADLLKLKEDIYLPKKERKLSDEEIKAVQVALNMQQQLARKLSEASIAEKYN